MKGDIISPVHSEKGRTGNEMTKVAKAKFNN